MTQDELLRQANRLARGYKSKARSPAAVRRARERATEIVLPWPKGQKPLRAEVLEVVFDALRGMPEKRDAIVQSIHESYAIKKTKGT